MILLLILSLLFPFQGKSDQFKQEISNLRNKDKFSITYDKFRDRTHVTVGSFWIQSENPYKKLALRLYVYAQFSYSGQSLEKSANDFFMIFRVSGREWSLLRNRHVYLIVGSERFDLGEGRHDGNVDRGGVFESLIVAVPVEAFSKLAAAPAAFKVGYYELALKDEHQEAFRDLYKLSRKR